MPSYVHRDALVDAEQRLQRVQVFVSLLVTDMWQHIVVLLQHIHGRLQDWSEEVASGLDAASIYEECVTYQFRMLIEVEGLNVAIGQSSEAGEDKIVACLVKLSCQLGGDDFLQVLLEKRPVFLVRATGNELANVSYGSYGIIPAAFNWREYLFTFM